MQLFNLLTLSPLTGDKSPTVNLFVYAILGVALVCALVLGVWKGKK